MAFAAPSPHPSLSLSDLEAFDPHAPQRSAPSGERRLLCPLCGHDKPKDAAHRSLSLHTQTGVWHCHRCAASGKLTDNAAPVFASSRERSRAKLHQAFSLPPANLEVRELEKPDNRVIEKSEKATSWRAALRGLQSLDDTRGAAYLAGRELSVEVAHQSGARFSLDFYGRPAVVFPLRDRDGTLRAAHGRYVDGRDTPKARTVGDKRLALFAAPDALNPDLPAIIVTEAPLDALSLAEAGYPAVALCGTEPPSWMHRLCAFRRVMLAFDADEAGERAGEKLAPLLSSFGAKCERMRPQGAKDWNEALQAGRDELMDWLAWCVLTKEVGEL